MSKEEQQVPGDALLAARILAGGREEAEAIAELYGDAVDVQALQLHHGSGLPSETSRTP